jgi:hypothetical protein
MSDLTESYAALSVARLRDYERLFDGYADGIAKVSLGHVVAQQ